MIKLNKNSKISELSNKTKEQDKNLSQQASSMRPEVVSAKVYKMKSAFVKNSVFITLSYIDIEGIRKPIEIFINSKDLNRSAEYVVLTRLISAIFRRATDPRFILEELHGIIDPNGGSFKDGKYFHSFYAEVGTIIERFFYDVGILKEEDAEIEKKQAMQEKETLQEVPIESNNTINEKSLDLNTNFQICPSCSGKSLKTENGCDSCVDCGYSKCDK